MLTHHISNIGAFHEDVAKSPKITNWVITRDFLSGFLSLSVIVKCRRSCVCAFRCVWGMVVEICSSSQILEKRCIIPAEPALCHNPTSLYRIVLLLGFTTSLVTWTGGGLKNLWKKKPSSISSVYLPSSLPPSLSQPNTSKSNRG